MRKLYRFLPRRNDGRKVNLKPLEITIPPERQNERIYICPRCEHDVTWGNARLEITEDESLIYANCSVCDASRKPFRVPQGLLDIESRG